MKDIWRDIPGFKNHLASNKGKIKNKNNNFILKEGDNGKGYKRVSIGYVHRLVALSFLENKENKKTVNHKDGNKENNNLENLEWATYSENHKHAFKIGLKKPRKGKDHPLFGKKAHNRKKVLQFDLNNNFIKEFCSIKSAKKESGAFRISDVCRGHCKQSGGFIWRFKEDEKK